MESNYRHEPFIHKMFQEEGITAKEVCIKRFRQQEDLATASDLSEVFVKQ